MPRNDFDNFDQFEEMMKRGVKVGLAIWLVYVLLILTAITLGVIFLAKVVF